MSNELRHNQILNILSENGSVSIRELMKSLFVSEATVRRDLSELERRGALKRTFGGARAITETNNQVPLFIRESLDSKAKDEICKAASQLIHDGNTVFLDGSSTAQYLVKYMAHLKDIVVVTYSIKTAELLCRNHIKTYCAGGLLIGNSLVCTGQKTLEFAESINPDICFISCKGVDEDGKFSDTSEEETAIRRAFMKNSRRCVLLMTANKFGSSYMHTLCRADEVDHIFSDAPVPEDIILKLRDR
jgi:DeoR/GlpR family transcriptional regulator of sugar metabolism